MKHKEQAYMDFMDMVRNAWTWKRMTADEHARFVDATSESKLSGTYDQRYEQMHNLYRAFLYGLNYQPIGWREPNYEGPSF